ncbi:glutathione S-transferase family protein [Govanella unica]|uniref:Glutathione S-transferase family protein n=1 Tax=Govanella unica TaxID=2975056 RepID=A0A9X3TYZ3_9PROT|nr:glutathione S-transferase family protein [Govania unica]MDA5194324.1 glutathione S-transferase family protein [Govania unica]
MALKLYYHPLSSFCHKVLIALYERGVAFEGQMINLGDPVAKAAFMKLWPTAKIPLLQDEDRNQVVPETSIMIEYLDPFGRTGDPMLPAHPGAQLDARLWDRLFDLYVSQPMQALVGNKLKPEDKRDQSIVDSALATLGMAYDMIETQLDGRIWAAGDRFSIADCAAAPALFYASILAPFPQDHPNLAAYFERLLARPSVARTLSEARPYFEFFPFKDAIPARFLQE